MIGAMTLTRRDLGKLALAAWPAGRLLAADWKKQPGLELYTVRDLLPKDYEGTVAKVAEIGYKEVEPATDYGKMDPKQFRAMLDRYGLTAPTTHVGATEGPDLERQLEGFQIMGIRYIEINAPRPAGRGSGAGRGAGGGAGAGQGRGTGAGRGPTEESAKHQAVQAN